MLNVYTLLLGWPSSRMIEEFLQIRQLSLETQISDQYIYQDCIII
jgi:hypothetical protein